MFEIAPHLAALLVGVAFLAGIVDSIAGGGGLLTVPALLLCGASPLQALATNKVQGTVGTGTALWHYTKAGQIRPREQLSMAAVSLAFGATGAMLAGAMPAEMLQLIMPPILLAIALFFAFKPGLSDLPKAARMSRTAFALTAVPLIAAFDGFFGPGTGSFFMLALVMLTGLGVLKATAHTKMLNFASNFGSLLVFSLSVATWWWVGGAMAVAQIAGATVGSRLAVRVEARLIKPLLVVTSTGMALRLLWQTFG
ncbi:MAG: TSUP family transporter [Cypionkella sp.]